MITIGDYRASLIALNGKFVEVYERETLATAEAKQSLGLSSVGSIKAAVGIAPIEEYALFEISAVAKNAFIDIDLDASNISLKLVSLYIDSPNADSVSVEIRSKVGSKILFKWRLNANATPVEFPPLVVPEGNIFRLTANDAIDSGWLLTKPAVLMPILVEQDPSDLP
jgi:hypothetical protein